MERFSRMPIKEVVRWFPEVAGVLTEYGIGCVPCSMGTCLLSDIVEIHNLSPADESALMTRIGAIVSPGRPVRPQERTRARAGRAGKPPFSPPMKMLVDEHALIKRFLALVPVLAGSVDVKSEPGRGLMRDAIDFIRSFADRYHHAKEEDILFACFDPGLDILKAMHEDHARGRACVVGLIDALERRDGEGVTAALCGYAEILSEHIKKEDEILYPWMDRNLSTRQVGEIFSKFREVDERFREARCNYDAFVRALEETFQAQGAEVGL